MAEGTVTGEDGLERCAWGAADPEYRAYHDEEWGRPEGDERTVFELLCLEAFQSGLSWRTILAKREGFRRAFAGFDPEAVARFGEADVARLVGDAAIVRHRAKILAAITNARATLALDEQGTSLAALVWAHEPARGKAPAALGEVPGSTPASTALARALRRHGFVFVGPTTAYATMQALGVVDDHLASCAFRAACEEARARFVPPR